MADHYGPSEPARADGAYVWDHHGRRYLDYRQGGGSSILGHGVAAPTDGSEESAAKLRSFILDRVSGCEVVHLVSSSDQARQLSIEMARAITGRPTVVNASADHLDDEVAAVIVQPLTPSPTGIAPDREEIELVAKRCRANGSLLIFDETMSGFRVAAGGVTEMIDVTPDLWSWGKVLEAGGSLGAVGGTAELASGFDAAAGADVSGAAAATAVAVLRRLDGPAYKMLTGRAEELAKPLRKAMDDAGLSTRVSQYGPVLAVQFSQPGFTGEGNQAAYSSFVAAMADRSILVPTGQGQPFFPSLAHSWDDIERTANAFAAAAAVVAAATAVERW